jgi:hypothetical protein
MYKVIPIAFSVFGATIAIIKCLEYRSGDFGGDVPEPSSIAILAVGLAGLATARAGSKRFRRSPPSPEPPEEP